MRFHLNRIDSHLTDMTSPSVCIRKITEEEVPAAFLIERLVFPNGEAEPEETLKFRQREAPELFWGYFEDGKLIGMTHGSQTSKSEATNECLRTHDPEGTMVCVISLGTHPEHRKKGVATALVKLLIQHVRDSLVHVTRVCLFCHEELVAFYEKLGFRYLGLSKVIHGPLPWYDLMYSIESDK